MKIWNLRMGLLAGSLAFGTAAFGIDLDLDLAVTGERFETHWEVNDASQTSVTFDFDGFVGVAASDVDSASQNVKIVDSANSGAALVATYTAPTTCTINGSHAVPSADVVVFDGAEVETGNTVSFTEGTNSGLQLRFQASGNHGDQAGAVACAGNGTLTYTY